MPTFLTLPLEVRLHIYEDVLVVPHEIRPVFDDGQEWEVEANFDVPDIALLYTSRQIFNESRPILYGKNLFHLSGNNEDGDGTAIVSCINSIGPDNMSFIRNLHIDFATGADYIAEEEGTAIIINTLNDYGSPLEASIRRGVRDIENRYEDSICVALKLVAESCPQVRELLLQFPGTSARAAGIFDEDFFSTRSQIRDAMKSITGVKLLGVDGTTDVKAVEEVAKAMGVSCVLLCWTHITDPFAEQTQIDLVTEHGEAGWVVMDDRSMVLKLLGQRPVRVPSFCRTE